MGLASMDRQRDARHSAPSDARFEHAHGRPAGGCQSGTVAGVSGPVMPDDNHENHARTVRRTGAPRRPVSPARHDLAAIAYARIIDLRARGRREEIRHAGPFDLTNGPTILDSSRVEPRDAPVRATAISRSEAVLADGLSPGYETFVSDHVRRRHVPVRADGDGGARESIRAVERAVALAVGLAPLTLPEELPVGLKAARRRYPEQKGNPR
jgi:hypothetical protein